jgi:uncharacterized membrane protein
MESNIIVLGFEGIDTAENMLSVFVDMQDKGLIALEDAVIVTRGVGLETVEVKQTHKFAGKYALRGSGIGLLAGLLLGGPIGGLVGGAAVGAIAGGLKDYGIDDDFIREATDALKPNSSALFLMGKAKDPDGFLAEIRPFKAVVAMTTLPEDREKVLRAALAHEE